MAWVYLLAAGACEVAWAYGLKRYGFRPTAGSAATIVGMLLSFVLLSLAMRTLPLGTAYAIWTGIGAVGAAVLGMAVLHEPRDAGRIVCVLVIVAGIVGLKVLTPTTISPAAGSPSPQAATPSSGGLAGELTR